jgi:hypothetical protein
VLHEARTVLYDSLFADNDVAQAALHDLHESHTSIEFLSDATIRCQPFRQCASVAFAAEADSDAVVAVFAPDGKLRLRIRQRLLPKITPRPILIEKDYFRYAVLMSSVVPPELFSQAVEQLRARGLLEENCPRRLSTIERRSWLYHTVRERGIAAGLEQGRQQGQQQAVQVLRRALLDVLELRGFTVTAACRARIEGCEQFDTLERWYADARVADPSTPLSNLLE